MSSNLKKRVFIRSSNEFLNIERLIINLFMIKESGSLNCFLTLNSFIDDL
jgi:hypothetical protein